MKLLFDANLSPKLVGRLAELFPGSTHVFDTDLARFTRDEQVWEYARSNGFVIVTADSDFLNLAEERGAPPKVVRLENCNYRTSLVESLIRQNAGPGHPKRCSKRRCFARDRKRRSPSRCLHF